MSAVITQRLVDLSRQLACVPHGQRTALCQAAADELGLSLAQLYRKLKEVSVSTTPRKRRTDSGQSALSRDEALTISAALMESARRNDKRLYSIGDAVQALRSSGLIRAESLDKKTGEIRPLSDSAIRRALHTYGLSPEQLLAPAPVTQLASLHPNHVWQIDASLCVLYYLKPSGGQNNGLQVMNQAEFYKNKPKNLARIAADRVWSYEITDHTSGWIYVEYVMGAESGENLCSVLINALQERGGADMLHGVPRILMMDPGSANTAAMTRNLCRALGIEMIVHAPGAARVTGQVENARNLIERKFEAGLRFQPVADLAELNQMAALWRGHFNATEAHSRHKKTRSALWMSIRQDQLIKAPSIEVCRELAVADPVTRKVTPSLRVNFQGRQYDVSGVPHVSVHDSVLVTRNPWRMDAAQLVTTGTDGHELIHVIPVIETDDYGFAESAAVIGEAYKSHAQTPAQQARQQAAQLAMGTQTSEETEAARKAKAVPFGGQLKPWKHIEEAELPHFLPRRGIEHELKASSVELPKLSVVELAKRLLPKVPNWSADSLAWLKKHHPEGATEEQVEQIAQDLQQQPKLRIVGGE